jgi:hypothetical protein
MRLSLLLSLFLLSTHFAFAAPYNWNCVYKNHSGQKVDKYYGYDEEDSEAGEDSEDEDEDEIEEIVIRLKSENFQQQIDLLQGLIREYEDKNATIVHLEAQLTELKNTQKNQRKEIRRLVGVQQRVQAVALKDTMVKNSDISSLECEIEQKKRDLYGITFSSFKKAQQQFKKWGLKLSLKNYPVRLYSLFDNYNS